MKTCRFFIVTFILLMFVKCQKSPINGDLDGYWKVVEVYPEVENPILKENLYYNIYMHVCMLTYYGGDLTTGNMRYEGNKLYLDFPNGDGYETVLAMRQYGIFTNPVVFTVEHLDKKSMVLRDGEVVVHLRKF